ncbi:uncharacterized protein LOC110694199 [Chenopodium quinoa]|uniref:uncharacterized protein LOC110694199 n=1 Tax=Chenopodium quinoa TaxID=63459 RepID=UPI000B772C5C|nr:uncharacterized protein LOC110694199 [Chenopodium quinoa]
MMAEITFKLSFFTVFISALLLLTQSGVISADEKIKVIIENESGNLLKELVKAGAVLQYDIHEMDEVSDETLSAKLKCTQCGRECSSWNDCCGICGCVYNCRE